MPEDAPVEATVLTVAATHRHGRAVRYSITGGNRDGLFTIDQHTGVITLAAALDYEIYDKHELVVAAEAGGETVHAIVQMQVGDVNDNPPYFLGPDLTVTVIEEDDRDLPLVLAEVEAEDRDRRDQQRLVYSVEGDGVDGYSPSNAFFGINTRTGQLLQLRALDRDPPEGKRAWRVRVQVRDGQPLKEEPLSTFPLTTLYHDSREESERRVKTERKTRSLEKGRRERKVENESQTARYIPFISQTSLENKKQRDDERKYHTQRSRPVFSQITEKESKESERKAQTPTSPAKVSRTFRSKVKQRAKPAAVVSHHLPDTITGSSSNKVDLSTFTTSSSDKLKSINKLIEKSIVNGLATSSTNKVEDINELSTNSSYVFKGFLGHLDDDSSKANLVVKSSGSINPSEQRLMASYNSQVNSLLVDVKHEHQLPRPGLTTRKRSLAESDRAHASTAPSTSRGTTRSKRNTLTYNNNSERPDGSSRRSRAANVSRSGSWSHSVGGCDDLQSFFWRSEGSTERGFGGDASGRSEGDDDDDDDEDDDDDDERVHMVEMMVTVMVKDINDNSPVFPNVTMFGEVQENGPIDLSVAVISAWDADDTSEGTNARLSYSIEKNVIDERTGEAIFAVHPETGLVRTALCCLDRETTPEYFIQVVASDGGGLKGTGTVVVRLADVNDNSPRLARREWELEMDETWGSGPPSDDTILEVVEASGWGWEHFGVRCVGGTGLLYAIKTLDYEDETHRRGFRFLVQVTDMGRGGWKDPRHLDAAWVSVRLRDINDNPPRFHRPHAHVTVREDAAPGTLLAALPAHDPDMIGQQKVQYHLTGGWDALTVDSEGDVTLLKALDREASRGAMSEARIIAVDSGSPPLSSTATLTITITDVNDSPPRLLPPTVFHIPEGAPATRLGVLKATDDDLWALGHGPPFNLTLAPSNPPHVLCYINLEFIPHLDSGRGGAEVWTVGGVDREEYRELRVGVWVADAGGLAAHQMVTVVIDDLNDNPMKPAAKTVYMWKTQGGGSDAPLGRVYVQDPDDWDLGDKSFQWAGPPNPLFSLNTSDGTVFASSLVREGRYDLQFLVSDLVWGQRGVAANVTVLVKLLTSEAIAHATPITLTPTTPTHLTKGWTPRAGGGGLGRLVAGVLSVVGEDSHTVEVVSVYVYHDPQYDSFHDSNVSEDPPLGSYSNDDTFHPSRLHMRPSTTRPSISTSSYVNLNRNSLTPESSSACVWLSVRTKTDGGSSEGTFVNPIKLQGLLALNTHELEMATNLTVVVGSPGPSVDEHKDTTTEEYPHSPRPYHDHDPSSAASRASTTLPLQVVDTNATSLVTPRLTRTLACCAHEPDTCTPTTCLNGGRCVASSGGNRCVCPGRSWGSRCKVLTRTFRGSGWAWVDSLLPCLPTTLSLRLLTHNPHALILYSGPLAPIARNPHSPPTPMIALQLVLGRPQLLIEGAVGSLSLEVNTTLNDGDWHTLHLHFSSQGVAMMIDLCGRGWEDADTRDGSHCMARSSWINPGDAGTWSGSGPLQVGGLAHTSPRPHAHGWRNAPSEHPLNGCVSHLTVNGRLVDLGEPAYSRASESGCHSQEAACVGGRGSCGLRGQCVGGLNHPECECDPGWTGDECATPTVPASLRPSSYYKVALSFTPPPRAITAQVRLRTRGAIHGLLLRLSAQHGSASFSIHCGRRGRLATTERLPADPHPHDNRRGGRGESAADALRRRQARRSDRGRPTGDVDECLWKPCLHGGSCYNQRSGFLCVCSPGHTGEYCQWTTVAGAAHPSAAPAAILGLCVSLLILVLLGVLYSVRLRRRRTNLVPGGLVGGAGGEDVTVVDAKYSDIDDTDLRSLRPDDTQETLVECLKLKVASCGQSGITDDQQSKDVSFLTSMNLGSPEGAMEGTKPEILLAKDDLRAYAYEGDGSSSSSITSAISGLRVELDEGWDIKPLVPGFLQVIDLLRNLPEKSCPDAGHQHGRGAKEPQEAVMLRKQKSPNLSGLVTRRFLPSPDGNDEIILDASRYLDSSSRCTDSSSRCADSSSRCADNRCRSADSSSRCADSSSRCADSSSRCADSSSKCNDGNYKCNESGFSSDGEVSTVC
ncbi:Neural-cadherin-like 11, partial [Homarus americanus]